MQKTEEQKEKKRAYDKARRLRLKAESAAIFYTPKPSVAKKMKKAEVLDNPKKSSTDIVCDYLKVGDIKEIKSKSKGTLGELIKAEVVKIYACTSTGKDYVRLKADGHRYHKRLNAFEPAE
jgi:hypothetical protein